MVKHRQTTHAHTHTHTHKELHRTPWAPAPAAFTSTVDPPKGASTQGSTHMWRWDAGRGRSTVATPSSCMSASVSTQFLSLSTGHLNVSTYGSVA